MRLLEGRVVEPTDSLDGTIQSLEAEIEQLRQDLSAARRESSQSKRDAARAISALRQQLGPLYQALQMVFGEIDAAGVGDDPRESAAPSARLAAVWASWKDKLGVGPAKVIDALLLHGEMNTAQLSIATGYHRNTVPQYVSACNKAGLINKNGGKFSLKQL